MLMAVRWPGRSPATTEVLNRNAQEDINDGPWYDGT